jgi:hypothetical protein
MSSVRDAPGLARAVAGPARAAVPAGASVNTFRGYPHPDSFATSGETLACRITILDG